MKSTSASFSTFNRMVVGLFLIAAPAVAGSVSWGERWTEGIRLSSPEGDVAFQLGGRIQADFSFADPDESVVGAFGPIRDDSEFRRARLFLSGTLYENFEIKVQYDFASGEADAKDVYIGVKKSPIGGVRIGHLKEPFSLEVLTSSKYITFLERSLPTVFAPERNLGVLFHGHTERLTWGAGLFRETDELDASRAEGSLNTTARLVGRPVWRDGGRRLVHLGLSLSHKDVGDEPLRFRQRPEAHLAPRVVATPRFANSEVRLADLELALVEGPFWAQAEIMTADIESPSLGDAQLAGSYLQAGYFVTGEHRKYKPSSGAFDRLTPSCPAGKAGLGAFEIAARYSILDLTDGAITGGETESLSLAANWYPNRQSRIMVDLTRADVKGVGEVDFFLVRFQVDF